MSATEPNGSELLRREILAEAQRQKDEVLRSARETADRLIAKAEEETAQLRKEKLEIAQAEAKRRRDAVLATVAVETNRMRLARIEELLQDIHARVGQRLESGDGLQRPEAIARLAAQALSLMEGNRFRIRLPQSDAEKFGNVERDARSRGMPPGVELRVEADPEMKKGSALLLSEDGRQMWEIGLESRLERLWPDLRRQIGAQAGFVENAGPADQAV